MAHNIARQAHNNTEHAGDAMTATDKTPLLENGVSSGGAGGSGGEGATSIASQTKECVTSEGLFLYRGANVYTRTWTPTGSVKCVVTFTHGLGEHCGRYDHVFNTFAQKGIKTYAFDIPSFGRSDGTRGTVDGFEAIYDCMDVVFDQAAEEGVPHFIYGHSMGGLLTLSYAVRRRQSAKLAGVIASAPLVRTVTPPNCCLKGIVRCLAGCAPTMALASGIDARLISRDDAEVDRYASDPLVHDQVGLHLAVDMFDTADFMLDEGYMLFKHPVIAIHGTGDGITSSDATAEFIHMCASTDKEMVQPPGLFHEIHNEPEKEEIITTMTDWILARL